MSGSTGNAGAGRRPVIVAAALALAAVAGYASYLALSPRVPLLTTGTGGAWVRVDRPFNAGIWRTSMTDVAFRKRFRVESAPGRCVLTVRSFRAASVWLDGKEILPLPADFDDWKSYRRVEIAPGLAAGEHEILILARNWNGPALTQCACPELGLYSGRDWEARAEGTGWAAARLAGDVEAVPFARNFPRADQAVFESSTVLVSSFLLAVLLALVLARRNGRGGWREKVILPAGWVRWILMGAWLALAISSLARIPPVFGFDAEGHAEYIRYLVQNRRIPLAGDMWEGWHPPFYYFVSALFYGGTSLVLDAEKAWSLIRVIPLACGVLQIEVAYRVLRLLFPGRNDLQAVGTAFAGLVPMNLYMSQNLTNEPLAALLSSIVLLSCARLVCRREEPPRRLEIAALGLTLGLAFLTKVSSALLVLPVSSALLYGHRLRGEGWRGIARDGGMVFGTAALVSGWYFVRNFVLMGSPYIANWDPRAGFSWWQEPGYRTIDQILGFGRALVHPIYAGTCRFWDSLYSTFWVDGYTSGFIPVAGGPPWNYDLAVSGALLGLFPSAMMIAGAVRTLAIPREEGRAVRLAAIALVGIYLATLLHLFITIPFYSSAKSFHTLGLLTCYAVLAAAGFDLAAKHPLGRAAACGLFFSWGVASYAAYFPVG